MNQNLQVREAPSSIGNGSNSGTYQQQGVGNSTFYPQLLSPRTSSRAFNFGSNECQVSPRGSKPVNTFGTSRYLAQTPMLGPSRTLRGNFKHSPNVSSQNLGSGEVEQHTLKIPFTNNYTRNVMSSSEASEQHSSYINDT